MPTDKRTESIHFKSFRRLAQGQVPDGLVVHADTLERAPAGAPDFLIQAAGRTIGVEHREVLKPKTGENERAMESNIDKILSMGQELCELRGTPSALVTVLFARTVPVPRNRKDRAALTRALAQLVHEHTPANGGSVQLEHQNFRGRNLTGVDSVYIHREPRLDHTSRWTVAHAASVWPDCIPVLQEAIDDKATKHATYIKHCDECWLLIVADSRRSSASMHADQLTHWFTSPFARTFFLDFGTGKVHSLNTVAP